jgi:phosphoglycolate phosphatase-like HAD superfamily hydrolase
MSEELLRQFQPQREFFIGIDSDGCIFDSMEIKHKECFTPMFIKHFGLQPVSRFARETWDFVNLYSKTRGVNRFPALSLALQHLRRRPEVSARRCPIPVTSALDAWIARETRLGNAALLREVEQGNHELKPVLLWSNAVNAMVEDLVHGVPPFPRVAECLEKLNTRADAMVISQTPAAALEREWKEHGLTRFVRLIAGQEMGTKTEHLKHAAASKYPPHRILMIGDAPGDYKAARNNGALFFPIVPGREEASWERLYQEGLDRFFEGRYAGDYEQDLVREFDASLPEKPAWETSR